MQYTQAQWLLFFFTYCFLGWVWESLYVSIRKREWINRGFLHGPLLPIYGHGAIIILWLTLPFRDSLLLIFVFGMLGATLLEYVTGAMMERLFGVRYWDYSDHPFNLNGHISLFTSLGWGLFSIIMVKILHPPLESLLVDIPYNITEPLSLILTIIIAVDTTKSVQAALNLKELIIKQTETNKSFELLTIKLDTAANSISQGSDEFRKHLHDIETEIKEDITLFQQKKKIRKESHQAFLLERIQEHRDKKSRLFDLLNEKADATIEEVQTQLETSLSQSEKSRLSIMLNELHKLKDDLKQAELTMVARKDKEYKVAANLIRRNPSSVSRRFNKAFVEIKSLTKERKKRHQDKKNL